MSHRLLRQLIVPALSDRAFEDHHDGARLPGPFDGLAFTTDSYVVRPLFFPGGDIGTLAVWGTVNDLAMCAARPVALSVGLILEEGLPMDTLHQVLTSMRHAADAVGVPLVTGDTKVVDRGKGDGLYVNTAGVGEVRSQTPIAPSAIRPGDTVVVSGDLGRHGVAVLSAREELNLDGLTSDVAPLWPPVEALLDDGIQVRCLRDLTRGGLASGLNEIAGAIGRSIRIRERHVPVDETVKGACELLGLDPLHVACEGRFVVFVAPDDADRAVATLRRFDVSRNAVIAGTVLEETRGDVILETSLGSLRPVDMLTGAQLPRIC